ncbi:MAG TPA: PAS domain S-box protein [Anaerolineales bacterium]|nr:PAS domain S-box protein [Anaerolineales bacterium]
MNTLSIPVVAMASISFYVGFYHLLIYFRRRQNREDLTFALLCFAIVFYDACSTGLYNASSVAEGAQWQRGQFVALALFVPAFLWFVSDYTHQKPGTATYLFSAFYLIALIVQLLDRSGLTLPVDQPSIKHITLPYVQPITYYEVVLGPFTTVQSLMGVVASTYILIMAIRYFRRGYKREAMPLILAIALMYAAGLHDTFVSNGVYDAIYFIEYAYLAVILMMAYFLSNTIVEAAMARDQLRKSEGRFRALVETTSDWVWEVDANGVYTYVSPKVRDLLGYQPEEVIGRTPFDLMPEEEAQRVNAIFQNIMLQEKAFESLENVARAKDGRPVVLDTSGVPFFDEHGKLAGYRGIDRDITERKQVEEALRAKTEELDRYFTSSLDLLCIADTEGYFRRLNPEWETALGYTLAELEGRQYIEFVHPEDVEATSAATARLADQRQVLNFENRYRCKDGSYRWIEWRAYPTGKMVYAVARDITKRKQVEEALRESEQKFRLFVEQSSDGLVFTDEQGFIIEWNQAQEHLTGFSRQESLGLSLWEFQTNLLLVSGHMPRLFEELKQKVSLALRSGRADFLDKPMEIAFFRRDGTKVVVQQMVFSIKTNQGYRLGSISRDITQLKEAEAELRASEERYRMLVEVSPTATWIAKDDIITYANPAALQVLGTTDPSEVVGRPAFDFIHPNYHAAVKERTSRMRREGKIAPLLEEKYLRLDGSVVDVEVIATPFTTSGDVIIQVFFQDVTKRKQAEKALRESETRHRALVESQIDLVSRYRPDTILTFVNDAYCKFYGKTREELIGQSYLFMIAPEFREQVAGETKKLVEENGTSTGEYINYRYDGKECWIQWVAKCITDESGRVIELQSVGRDITQLKQAEAERERLIAELESKNTELERFTYTVSHDLKAPLITIRGFLGFIEQDAHSGNLKRMKEDIQRISAASDKMQRLLDELLELSRIGRLMKLPANIAFGVLIQEALKLLEGQLRERNVEVKIQDNLPMVFGDSQRLLEVIQNLLDNAIKFIGKQPQPVIEIGTQGKENGTPVFYVRDNGIGIAPEHHERIFGLFNKLDPRAEGTGVGLAIVKRIIEVHGGRIWVESEEGKGATFYFTLGKGSQDSGVVPTSEK